jgi:hypothetical protein
MSLEPGGESVVIGGSVTEDMSLLLGDGVSGTATTTGLGDIIVSFGGFGAGKGTGSSLDPQNTDPSSFNGTAFIGGSGKIDGTYYWIAWQAVLSAFIGVSAFV